MKAQKTYSTKLQLQGLRERIKQGNEVLYKFLEIRGRLDAGIDTDYSQAFDMAERLLGLDCIAAWRALEAK